MPDWVEGARYVLAAALWVMMPAAVAFWLLIHPLARFWRKVGPAVTYSVAVVVMAVVGAVSWLFHEQALADRPAMKATLIVAGAVLYGFAVVIERKCRRYLKLRTLVGVPEVTEGEVGVLLTEGIYAHTRNPRYLDLAVGLGGWALILNIPALYWMIGTAIVAVYLIAVLEERELSDRFGAPYEEYRKRVPRMLPRSWAFLRS